MPRKKTKKSVKKSKGYNEEEKVVSEDVIRQEDFEGETAEQIESEMEEGKRDVDVYSEEGREKLIEDREIEDWEEGFMEGAEGRGGKTSCKYCGKLLEEDKNKIFEREFDDEIYFFCSEEHAEKYVKKQEKKKR